MEIPPKDQTQPEAPAQAEEPIPVHTEMRQEDAEPTQHDPSKQGEPSIEAMPEEPLQSPPKQSKGTNNDTNITETAKEKNNEPAMPSDDAIAEKLREDLKEVNLATTTGSSIDSLLTKPCSSPYSIICTRSSDRTLSTLCRKDAPSSTPNPLWC